MQVASSVRHRQKSTALRSRFGAGSLEVPCDPPTVMPDADQFCALCAIRPAVNREHVPAKALFPKPCPPGLNLITVPSCGHCNGGSRLDDEYFRSYFALRIEETPIEALTMMREAATRAFTDPKSRGLRGTFARTLSDIWAPEGDGGVLTKQTRITPDLQRVGKVILKHVRGVYYHVTGRALPAGASLMLMPDYKIQQLSEERQRGFDSWTRFSLAGECDQIGDVFGYALRFADYSPNAFVLSLFYYKTFFYHVMTRPQTFNPGPLNDSWDHAAMNLPDLEAGPLGGAERRSRLI